MTKLSLFQEYVLVEVIGVGEEEEESEPVTEADAVEQAERLNDRRVQLAGFLKLVLFGAVDMKVAAPIFAQYVRVSGLQLVAARALLSSAHTSPALPPLWRPYQDGSVKVP